MAKDSNAKGFSPPYNIPWATFHNTIEKVVADLPNKIDRSYLSSQSGTVQGYLISAFKGFGFIKEDGTVEQSFRELAADPEGRPARIAALLEQHYPKAVELGRTNSTMGELDQAFAVMFPSVTGASRVKSIRFYLAAAEYAKIARSPLWKAPKAAPSGGVRRRKRNGSGSEGREHSADDTQDENTSVGNAAMKEAYFNLLLKMADGQEQIDTDLLDRIERVAGLKA